MQGNTARRLVKNMGKFASRKMVQEPETIYKSEKETKHQRSKKGRRTTILLLGKERGATIEQWVLLVKTWRRVHQGKHERKGEKMGL